MSRTILNTVKIWMKFDEDKEKRNELIYLAHEHKRPLPTFLDEIVKEINNIFKLIVSRYC